MQHFKYTLQHLSINVHCPERKSQSIKTHQTSEKKSHFIGQPTTIAASSKMKSLARAAENINCCHSNILRNTSSISKRPQSQIFEHTAWYWRSICQKCSFFISGLISSCVDHEYRALVDTCCTRLHFAGLCVCVCAVCVCVRAYMLACVDYPEVFIWHSDQEIDPW